MTDQAAQPAVIVIRVPQVFLNPAGMLPLPLLCDDVVRLLPGILEIKPACGSRSADGPCASSCASDGRSEGGFDAASWSTVCKACSKSRCHGNDYNGKQSSALSVPCNTGRHTCPKIRSEVQLFWGSSHFEDGGCVLCSLIGAFCACEPCMVHGRTGRKEVRLITLTAAGQKTALADSHRSQQPTVSVSPCRTFIRDCNCRKVLACCTMVSVM